jgi:hypothetical protein
LPYAALSLNSCCDSHFWFGTLVLPGLRRISQKA